MFDRLAESARDAVTRSVHEADRLGDRRVGTGHLLLGLLHDSEIAVLLGVDLEVARAGSRALDQRALAAIGINTGDLEMAVATRKRRRLQLTSGISSGARSVFPRALTLANVEKARRIKTKHLLLALLEREQPDPAAALLTELQIDRSDIRTRVAGIKP